jgi:integrase/recombinase XerD
MLFDWLVTGQILPSNPAHSVRGPALFGQQGLDCRHLLRRSPRTARQHGHFQSSWLRDRALVAIMAFTFARVSAVIGLKVEDY